MKDSVCCVGPIPISVPSGFNKGPHQKVIEACRKADWFDASKGMSKQAIREVEDAFPNEGFHDTLLRLAKDYDGSTLVGGVKVTLGIVKW